MAAKILIAEDEPNIVISIEFLLSTAGYEVVIARDGTEALDLIEASPPDLVVLDVMLPGVNGFEVCRRLRQSERGHVIKVLMLTARGQQGEAERGISAGADAYMTKPFATRELIETVAGLLGRPAARLLGPNG